MRKKKIYNKSKINIKKLLLSLLIFMCLIIIANFKDSFLNSTQKPVSEPITYFNISDIPKYNGDIYVTINNNVPYFQESEYTTQSFEVYSQLDEFGRCGVAYANICREIIPAKGDKRGDISSVKPTGWKQKKYDGEYLYNRCHLIGYQLSDENANELNLITGTRYFNVVGMLPFENKVAEYLSKNKDNHVLYRVTPVFEEENYLASRCRN